MDNTNQGIVSSIKMSEEPYMFDNRNMVILGLIILLLLAVLGINLLSVSGNILQSITNIFAPLILNILSLFGYATGTILNKTADVVGDTSKLGIDIAEGTVQSIGNLLKNSSNLNIDNDSRKSLDDAINIFNRPMSNPVTAHPPAINPNESFSTIQSLGIESSADVNDNQQYGQQYGYIKDENKSISGHLRPSQSMIFNPVLFERNSIQT